MATEQGKQPTIFLVEEDEDTRVILKESLTRYGYRVSVAIDEEDAFDRVSGGQMKPALILVNLVGKSAEDVLQTGRRIREHAKFDGHTPLVVMAEKYGKDVEGTEVNVGGNDWIFYLGEELDQLQNLLRRLTGK
jgi:PleD family two-component response regulator